MTQVLVVDDDESFLASLADGLATEGYDVATARSGLEALQLLESRPVDLILTDIKMPRMDGIQLIQELMKRDGFIPCIVMTAFGTPDLESRVGRLGALEFVNKPIDLPALKAQIREALSGRHESSLVRGIGLPSFLQVLAAERKTCTVKVTGPGGSGLMFLREGVLYDATVGDKDGVEAAYELLCWEKAEIALRNGCRRKTRVITEDLSILLLEAMRLSDESARARASWVGDVGLARLNKEDVMALESHLNDFKDVKGYIASGIMDFTGEILASHSTNPKIDLAATGAVFNDIFRGAHEASSKIGLEACRTLALTTPKGVIVMECSGVNTRPHVHMIVILEESGNQALVKMTIGKILPKIVGDLT